MNASAKTKLLELCEKFIKDNNIHCSDSIYQRDDVIENGYEFIEQICDIVGYAETDED